MIHELWHHEAESKIKSTVDEVRNQVSSVTKETLTTTLFDFHSSFVDWISIIFHSIMLSIRINDSLVGFFPCSRGVRQNDHLFPLLFYLAEEVLSRCISKLVNDKKNLHMLVRKVISLPLIFYMLMTYLFSDTICSSLENGGLKIINLRQENNAYILKLA